MFLSISSLKMTYLSQLTIKNLMVSRVNYMQYIMLGRHLPNCISHSRAYV